MKVVTIMITSISLVIHGLVPIETFWIYTSTSDMFHGEDVRVPMYWYLILLELIANLVQYTAFLYHSWGVTDYWFAYLGPEALGASLRLIFVYTFGMATATLQRRINRVGNLKEFDIVNKGKLVLQEYKYLKDGCQIGMLSVFAMLPSLMVLEVTILVHMKLR